MLREGESLLQGKVHQLVIQCQVVGTENMCKVTLYRLHRLYLGTCMYVHVCI